MDYNAISSAIVARFLTVTKPTGEDDLQGTDEPPNTLALTPLLVVMPNPDEVFEYGPSKIRYTLQQWNCLLMRDQRGDYPARMTAMAAWRTACKDALMGQIQLGLTYVDWAELRTASVTQRDWGEYPYDTLDMIVEVKTREVVTGAAA